MRLIGGVTLGGLGFRVQGSGFKLVAVKLGTLSLRPPTSLGFIGFSVVVCRGLSWLQTLGRAVVCVKWRVPYGVLGRGCMAFARWGLGFRV